jgi:predicted membrane channel-forming protein YqfA (hemolysin III family)
MDCKPPTPLFGLSSLFLTSRTSRTYGGKELTIGLAFAWGYMRILDVGIVALIVGSNYPALYYGFYCSPARQITYTALITLLGLLTTFTVLSPTYCTSAYRWARTSLFLLLGLSAVLPVSHVVYSYGFNRARSEIGLGYLLESGGLYVVGALTYAVRFPERRWPRTFDLVGSSHQIFRSSVCLSLAILLLGSSYHAGLITALLILILKTALP